MGDFRGYNPDAVAPSLNTGSDTMEVVYASSVGSEATTEIVLNLGEVDWFGEETEMRGRNNISTAYVYVYAFKKVKGSSGTSSKAGSCHKDDLERSGYQKRAPIEVGITVPSSGSTIYEITFGLGYADKIYAWFPNMLTLKVTRLSGAVVYLRILASALPSLKQRLVGLSDTDQNMDLYDVLIGGGTMEITTAMLNASFSALTFMVESQSHNLYLIIATKLTISGTVKCYSGPINQSGSVLKSSTTFTNQTIVTNGYGRFSATFTLSETANDGEYFYIDITGFSGASIQVTPN